MFRKTEIVIYDCEYYADEGSAKRSWRGINDLPPHLLQIAAARLCVSDEGVKVIKTMEAYVKCPVKLCAYIIALTGITDEMLEKEGVPPVQALKMFERFVGNRPIYSFGNDIRYKLLPTYAIAMKAVGLKPDKCRDFRHVLKVAGYDDEFILSTCSSELSKKLGLKESERVHNAMGDVMSLVTSLDYLLAKGQPKASRLCS